jgi:hypothetical protein
MIGKVKPVSLVYIHTAAEHEELRRLIRHKGRWTNLNERVLVLDGDDRLPVPDLHDSHVLAHCGDPLSSSGSDRDRGCADALAIAGMQGLAWRLLDNLIALEQEVAPHRVSWTNNTWDVHPDYPKSDWLLEAENGDTVLGYREWVEHQLDMAADEAADEAEEEEAP